jgi:hypothetical protein
LQFVEGLQNWCLCEPIVFYVLKKNVSHCEVYSENILRNPVIMNSFLLLLI